MDGIQGAILRVKLRYLDRWTEARRTHATQYDALLATSGIKTPVAMPYSHHVYHVYVVRVPQREALQQKLNEQGIQTGIHYPIPVHLQKAFADLGHHQGDFPKSELVAAEVLSLPMYPELSEAQIKAIATAVCESCS